MKVCLVSSSDGNGGAFKAAYRLHQGLLDAEVSSHFVVGEKTRDDHTILGPSTKLAHEASRFTPYFDRLPLRLYPQRKRTPFSLQWFPDRVMSQINPITPNIINLHWINAGYLQIETLAKLKKPLVWTLHDMWGFTGGCHYAEDCEGYKNKCGHCPQLRSNRQWDLSRWVWQRKAKAWQSLDLTIVTPSHWLAQRARESSLFQEKNIEVIPNGLDLKRFKPINSNLARKMMELPKDKKLILFGAINSLGISRKGSHLLVPALQQLSQWADSNTTELVIFGASEPKFPLDFGLKTHYLGKFNDEVSLVLLYSAVDVFVAPSTEDNLPCTIMESLACGTPCVAFKVGGIPELIEHKYNGYLANPFDSLDFAGGINWILEDGYRSINLKQNARKTCEQNFDIKLQVYNYHSLFMNLLARN